MLQKMKPEDREKYLKELERKEKLRQQREEEEKQRRIKENMKREQIRYMKEMEQEYEDPTLHFNGDKTFIESIENDTVTAFTESNYNISLTFRYTIDNQDHFVVKINSPSGERKFMLANLPPGKADSTIIKLETQGNYRGRDGLSAKVCFGFQAEGEQFFNAEVREIT